MWIQTYKKCIYYLKSTGTCVIIAGGCWILYQLHQTSQVLHSAVTTNVLELEKTQAQYIYMDNPCLKDVLMPQNKKDLYSSVSEKSLTFTYIIMKWWKSLSHDLAYRLVCIAQNGCKNDHLKAVEALSNLKYLKDWHYWRIAQMLDARTAVALTRIQNVDLRFFLKPPYHHVQYKLHDIIEKLHDFLIHLDKLCNRCHPCLSQFLNKKFGDFHRDRLIFDHDLTSMGLAIPPVIVWDQELLQNCVHAVYHHSSFEQHSRDIVDAGGLAILMAIQKLYGDNIYVCILLAKILSNISLYNEYTDDIFKSGWVGILAAWTRNEDVQLSATAYRALANLDADNNANDKYPKHIYLLYPLHRVRSVAKLDAIFVHGLLGGVFITWRQRNPDISGLKSEDLLVSGYGTETLSSVLGEHPQEFLRDLAYDLKIKKWKQVGFDFEVILHDCPEKMNYKACGPFTCKGDDICMEQGEYDRIRRTQCWPRDWLPKDVPSLRVIGINYNTNLSMWTPSCPMEGIRSTISERSNEFITKLLMSSVGKRPIVWVCHSMGGLLVKKMLVEVVSIGSLHKVLRGHKLYPYRAGLRQQLYGGDPDTRVQFSTWCLRRLQDDGGFFTRVLFTDEATFSNLGCSNCHNFRHWAPKNPHWIREVPLQHRWRLNVWCGIMDEHLIGPYFFDDVLTGHRYGDFLRESLPALLEDIPLEDRARMWYQQDGAPPHRSHANLAHLNMMFPARWIGISGPVRWPARFPNLTPLDFFLCGKLKELAFVVPPTTLEAIRQCIVDACARITVEELRNVQRSFIRRLERCVEHQGRHFEHLL